MRVPFAGNKADGLIRLLAEVTAPEIGHWFNCVCEFRVLEI